MTARAALVVAIATVVVLAAGLLVLLWPGLVLVVGEHRDQLLTAVTFVLVLHVMVHLAGGR